MSHKIAILGASGYTGAELVRLIATHPGLEIAALAANSKAGQDMAQVFPHLRHLDLPVLVTIDEIDFAEANESMALFFLPPHPVQCCLGIPPRGIWLRTTLIV